MRGGERIVHPGWQLRVRATDYTTGYGQIYDIRTLLEGIRRERVDIGAAAYRIDAVTIISDILPLGQEPEGKRRDTFTLNGIMTFTTLTP